MCKGKVMFDYLHTKYDDSGLSLTDVSNLVVKCTTSAECQTIRIAASAVMDSWNGHTVSLSDVF